MRHINFIRVILALIIVLIVSVYLPEFFRKASRQETNRTNVFYSPINKKIILGKYDIRGASFSDPAGKIYSRDEFEELTPFLNFRQLMLSGKMPDTLDGVPIVPREVSKNNVMLRATPAMINFRPLQLFPLFESASGRLRLELPPDFFRITNRMEFVTSMANAIDEGKSVLFTVALMKAGFDFPSKAIYGNPTTRKPFDEGYFVIDNSNKVFHIKMMKGKPFCKETGIPANLGIAYMSIAETELREYYGMIITNADECYFISYNNYKLIKLPVENYNRLEDNLQVRGDLFYRILIVNKDNGFNTVITNRHYDVIDRYSEKWQSDEEKPAGVIASYIFPCEVSIEKNTTPFVNFYFRFPGMHFLILSVILLLITIFFLRKNRVPAKRSAVYYLLVLCTGLFGFIAVLSVRDFDDDGS